MRKYTLMFKFVIALALVAIGVFSVCVYVDSQAVYTNAQGFNPQFVAQGDCFEIVLKQGGFCQY